MYAVLVESIRQDRPKNRAKMVLKELVIGHGFVYFGIGRKKFQKKRVLKRGVHDLSLGWSFDESIVYAVHSWSYK